MADGWGGGLPVGVAELDEGHRDVELLLGELCRRVDAGDARGAAAALDALGDGIVRHFATEEALMERWGYPERAGHKGAHDLFLQDLTALARALGEDGLSEEVADWARVRTRGWLSFHVETNDLPMGRWLLARRRRGEGAGARSPRGKES